MPRPRDLPQRRGGRLTGWTSGEAEGHPLTAVFHIINEHTRQPVEDPVEKVFRLGTVWDWPTTRSSSPRTAGKLPSTTAAPIRQGDGTVQGVVLVFRDFTEQKTERLLARLAAIVESSEEAIVSKDLRQHPDLECRPEPSVTGRRSHWPTDHDTAADGADSRGRAHPRRLSGQRVDRLRQYG